MIVLSTALALPALMPKDPAPGLFRSKERSRNLICKTYNHIEGTERFPGVVPPPRPRGDYAKRSVVACAERVITAGRRPARDEAVLERLTESTQKIVAAAKGLRPDLHEKTWMVEAHYPSAQVAAKISFATKTALMAEGLPASDRTPVLAVGDVEVLARMPPKEAYPTACVRYGLDPDIVLLSVLVRDPRETMLHAGLCTGGTWMWLQ